jgi:hypothetical protein
MGLIIPTKYGLGLCGGGGHQYFGPGCLVFAGFNSAQNDATTQQSFTNTFEDKYCYDEYFGL